MDSSLSLKNGDFGVVGVVDGDLIEGGLCTSLLNGLETMCTKNDTCFLTVSSSTCTVISQNGAYAVVDSRASVRWRWSEHRRLL